MPAARSLSILGLRIGFPFSSLRQSTMAKLPTTARRTVALALALLLLCQSPALAGIVVYRGTQGLTMSGADGVYYDNTAGLTMSGADGLLGLSVNGIGVRATGDGLTMSGADGLTMSGADSVTYT